jgi:hypothetical protein
MYIVSGVLWKFPEVFILFFSWQVLLLARAVQEYAKSDLILEQE